MLPRALDPLRKQTFTDWTCELYHDTPEDDFPKKLLGSVLGIS